MHEIRAGEDPKLGDVFYLIGVVRMQIELPDVRAAILTLDKVEKPAAVLIDGNGIGLGIYQDLKQNGMRHLSRGSALEQINAANLKADRFRRALSSLYDGKVRIPVSMPGLDILLAELATFPDGKNDDQVDYLGIVAGRFKRVVFIARQGPARCRL